MIVFPRGQVRAALGQLADTGNLLDDVVVRLFVNDIQPGQNSVLADFVEATFGGYAASAAVVWSDPYSLPDGSAVVDGGGFTVVCTGTPVDETIYGYYLTKSGVGGALVEAVRLATPIPIGQVGDGGTIVPQAKMRAVV